MDPTAPPADHDYLSSGEVARIFGVNVGTVTRWSDEGKLPHFKTLGGKRRFSRDDVERLKANGAAA